MSEAPKDSTAIETKTLAAALKAFYVQESQAGRPFVINDSSLPVDDTELQIAAMDDKPAIATNAKFKLGIWYLMQRNKESLDTAKEFLSQLRKEKKT